jgi:enamine deaminase RidA (YjgF/YER057c/UK114 family)
MMIFNPASLPSPRGYSNGILLNRVLFIAGQIGWNEKGVLEAGLVGQFERALMNIAEIVRSAGGSIHQIGRFTIFVKDKIEYMNRQKEIGEAYRRHMGKHFPAMSLVVVKDLLEEGALVEIEATAVLE